MNTMPSKLLLLFASATLSVTTLPGQAGDVREMAIPTASITLSNVTSGTIGNQIANGYRLTDLEYRSGAGGTARFDAVLVENTGPYQITSWWYSGTSASAITNAINVHQARLIDLESYVDSNGTRRFAAVMVDNTGVNGKAWWWLYDTDTATISQSVASNTARIVDLDRYEVNGQTRYLALMVSNTGADARQWWWYRNVSSIQIDNYATSNGARVYDVEKAAGGAFDCVMIRDPLPKDWYWWSNLSAGEVAYLQQNYGVRAIDVESYPGPFGTTRYAMATINNSNALTTEVGRRMRQATDGQVGCWLQEVNGSNLAWLNGNTPFEPAEAVTVLHHAHSMRQIHLGSSQTNSLVTVYQDYSATESGCPVDSSPTPEALETVLHRMMRDGDARRTQAITNYYGSSSLLATASMSLGMEDTELNHRIGCQQQALVDPNRTSLRDLHGLHEQVANGWLGNQRDPFYAQMEIDLGVYQVVFTEAQLLGMSQEQVSCFANYLRIAHRGGNYTYPGVSAVGNDVADFGFASIPFVQNGVVAPREFTYGAFVNGGSSNSGAYGAVYVEAVPELLRPLIRAALAGWSQNIACTTTIGFGCGAPVHRQTASAMPRLGATVHYDGIDGHPNAISAIAIGLSSTQSGGVPLPVSLASIGGEANCRAYNDVVSAELAVSNGIGATSFAFPVPSSPSLVGLVYFTQLWSFGAASLKTSNSLRHVIGR